MYCVYVFLTFNLILMKHCFKFQSEIYSWETLVDCVRHLCSFWISLKMWLQNYTVLWHVFVLYNSYDNAQWKPWWINIGFGNMTVFCNVCVCAATVDSGACYCVFLCAALFIHMLLLKCVSTVCDLVCMHVRVFREVMRHVVY